MAASYDDKSIEAVVEFEIAKKAVYEFTKSFLLSGKEAFINLDGNSGRMKYVDSFGNLIGGAIGLVAPGAGKSAAAGIKKPFDHKDKEIQKTRKETFMSILNSDSKFLDDNFQELLIERGVGVFIAYETPLMKIHVQVGKGDNALENQRRAVQKLGKYAGSFFLEHIIESGSTNLQKLLDTLRTPSELSKVSFWYQKTKQKVIKPKFYFFVTGAESKLNEASDQSRAFKKIHVTASDFFLNNVPELKENGQMSISEEFWCLHNIGESAGVQLTSAAISTDRKLFHALTLLAPIQDVQVDLKEIRKKLDLLANSQETAEPTLTTLLDEETDLTWGLKENSMKIKLLWESVEGQKNKTGSLPDIASRISKLNKKLEKWESLKEELEGINQRIVELKKNNPKWDAFHTQNMLKSNSDGLEQLSNKTRTLRSSLNELLRSNFSDKYKKSEKALETLHQDLEFCSTTIIKTDRKSLEFRKEQNQNMISELTKIRCELPEIKEALLALQGMQLHLDLTTFSFERSPAAAEKTAQKNENDLREVKMFIDERMASRALPILKMSQTSRYELLTENFISVLKKVGDCPFAVYCMSGHARLGKFYTLNFFIRKLRGQEIVDSSQLFKWRKGSDRETVGINLWPEPFFMNDGNGRKIGILLMDAQGLFDEHTTLQQNSVIFALSSLFSTICIFNLFKQILSDALENVNFFTGYARAIDHNREKQGDLDNDSKKFKRLVILVRDFEDDDDFGYGYHDNSRAPLNSQGGRANYFYKIFHASGRYKDLPNPLRYDYLEAIYRILENYDNVGIVLHPDPGEQFKKSPTENSPKKKFVEKSKEFLELMLSPEFLVTKKIGGQELTGMEFIPYVEHSGDICQNAGETFPPPQTISESVSIMSHTLAHTTAYNEFIEKITIFLKEGGLSDAQLNDAYETAKKFALEEFHKIKKLGAKEKERETINILLQKCKAKFETLKEVYSLEQSLDEAMK